jgi:hypothetical protein
MQVFEFYFNPRAREDEIYQAFLYEPANVLERKLGSLYLVGNLSKVLPQNINFLEKLSSQIKKRYYSLSAHSSEKALRESLAKTNEFLADEVQKENVDWLGNLTLAVCTIKDYIFNFTLVGDIKIFLLRSGKIIDIGKNLELEGVEPWPLKVFGNIVTGKLSQKDKILILTKEVFDFFSEQNILQEIAKLDPLDEKKLKGILKNKEKLFSEISGAFLLVDLSEEITGKGKIAFEKGLPTFSLSQIFAPLTKLKLPALPGIRLPQVSSPLKKIRTPRVPEIKSSVNLKRNLIIVLGLVVILIFGGFFARMQNEKEKVTARDIIEKVKTKVDWADRSLAIKDKDKANQFYQEACQEILPLTKTDNPLKKEALDLKGKIEGQLFTLNQLEKITDPETLFDSTEINFIPQEIILSQGKIYLFSPATPNIYQLDINKKSGEFIQTDKKFSLAASLYNATVLFYLRPDSISSLNGAQLGGSTVLKNPYPDFYFDSLSVFGFNLYFLDNKKGEIVKYFFQEGQSEISGKLWLNDKAKKPIGAKSIAVDGSLWVLNNDNSVDKFYGGNFQETVQLKFFPYAEDFSKILAFEGLPYFYILEPIQKRVIILGKGGQVIKQFQSDKFDNLKDFTVSENGKTIYLLNGLKIYKVSF